MVIDYDKTDISKRMQNTCKKIVAIHWHKFI